MNKRVKRTFLVFNDKTFVFLKFFVPKRKKEENEKLRTIV